MGICFWEARQLWDARERGVALDSTLTIGRQNLSLHPEEVRHFERAILRANPGREECLAGYHFGEYADRFLREGLGVRDLQVLDASDYEGANLIHDLNAPVPDAWHQRFDAVIESGTIEHVFNLPMALANLMVMLRPGGTLFLSTPANNLCGHGFYQFSPELMYRVFSSDNGFAITTVLLYEARSPSVELSHNRAAYLVPDPASVGDRIRVMSSGPLMMVLEARRELPVAPFRTFPVQSDYARAWIGASHHQPASAARALWRRIYGRMPRWLQLIWQQRREVRDATLRKGPHFISLTDR